MKFIFYKLIVKLYQSYFSIIKKLGWNEFRNSPMLFLARQKLVHITVMVIAVSLVYGNLTAKAKWEGTTDIAAKTIIASLIESEFSSQDEQQMIEEFFDEEPIISPMQEKYLRNLSAVRNEPIINTKSEAGSEAEPEGVMITRDGTAIVKQDMVETAKTKRLRKEVVYYTVQPGDVIGQIAGKFDLKASTVLWENELTAYSIIRPGDKLAILPVDGITYKVARGDSLDKIANKYDVEKEKIIEINNLEGSKGLAAGQKLLIPGGRKTQLASTVITPKPTYSGIQVIKDLIKKPAASATKGDKLLWPTPGYRITQYYSWRHHGLDVADKIGTPIYAVDDGVVEVSGWGKGYGNTILINHGGGRKTRYGHFSKLYVKAGDEVTKGETIGAMGSTGWSTGSHLHFEIIINGVKYNPLNYLAR